MQYFKSMHSINYMEKVKNIDPNNISGGSTMKSFDKEYILNKMKHYFYKKSEEKSLQISN